MTVSLDLCDLNKYGSVTNISSKIFTPNNFWLKLIGWADTSCMY